MLPFWVVYFDLVPDGIVCQLSVTGILFVYRAGQTGCRFPLAVRGMVALLRNRLWLVLLMESLILAQDERWRRA
jgi:hypothetical protein